MLNCFVLLVFGVCECWVLLVVWWVVCCIAAGWFGFVVVYWLVWFDVDWAAVLRWAVFADYDLRMFCYVA